MVFDRASVITQKINSVNVIVGSLNVLYSINGAKSLMIDEEKETGIIFANILDLNRT